MVEVDNQHDTLRAFLHSGVSESREAEGTKNINNDSNVSMIKRYLVYMELPKIKIGDYHKSSCIVGNILRFHFLMKIAQNEDLPLRLLPIRVYKVPVVNVAVIHRPFIEDEIAKGPIPKSPDVKSPLIRYEPEERDTRDGGGSEANLAEDFRKGSVDSRGQRKDKSPTVVLEAEDKQLQRDASRHKGKKRKKYFVYCELPKVAIGDYRISSVTSSELIHCHFLMKIAQDETNGQPRLQPIRKYRRPRVNFAVIHRSLIVDDEAEGPIPRSPGVKSPMIREDDDGDGDDNVDVLHATMGFNYGTAAPKSKYELLTQWSLVADERGRIAPELVLSKAGA